MHHGHSPTQATPKPHPSVLRYAAPPQIPLTPTRRIDPAPAPDSADPQSHSLSPDPPSPNPTTISLTSTTASSSQPVPPSFAASVTHPAEIGLGLLHGEEQLKNALQSKDRMFVLVLAKELEAFIARVANGALTASSASGGLAATTSTLAALGLSAPLTVTPSSKFQRMLVYKSAEWYGIKAVPGPDGSMIIGVLGTFNDKSTSLRLSDLVPAAPSPAQKFRIMQRTPASTQNASAEGSSSSSLSDTAASNKLKTLEEREAAYAVAREKIYGKAGETEESSAPQADEPEVSANRAAAALEDDIDPVPRRRYGPSSAPYEVIYASLYHPSSGNHTPSPAPNMLDQYGQQQPRVDPMYGYQPANMDYAQFSQMDTNGHSAGAGYHQGTQTAYGYGGYSDGQYPAPQQPYMVPGWQPSAGYPQTVNDQQQQQQQYGMVQSQGGQWYQPTVNQPMPAIQQGIPYAGPTYGYSQPPQQPSQTYSNQQQRPAAMPPQGQSPYSHLVQPTPQRPHPHPHSSASSSISSRSYQSQSYPESSRPHSRGSNTSNRSAASSVRLGAMYPAGQAPGGGMGGGYRQKGMKQQGGLNGMTSLGLNEGKRGRGHSPVSLSSTTTASSSHSSRRTSSINVPPPSQHQLPQRPDWAANNVPYHPSPMVTPPNLGVSVAAPGMHGGMGLVSGQGPSAAEFPPLLRSGTAAEPMQVERAKMRPMTTPTVWGAGATAGGIGSPQMAPHVPSHVAILSAPRAQSQPPLHHHAPPAAKEEDPDFPRRVPAKAAPTLYDPSAPSGSLISGGSRPPSVNANPRTPTSSRSMASGGGLSPEEVIEAKLAAVSISAGVSIGPPPSRQNQAASYAKIARRE
ncbi:hypothetical protein L198_05096 [Cryptococcus wingfieldii CBS 7118]|uniref:SUZ domain-containing protein n=1 Tax=Cryptococcus wingfieldii CBS 7118 TaxID=1295528 RepID=A0A1E3J2Q8_9TREE|nr:hypothetical protein L198_05096 [Cryptococcus wingfieldii CBS 7118]ODN94241.1 hypothetical protein L198_05096 [Cryptococcus wingfieldii CBS 7118]